MITSENTFGDLLDYLEEILGGHVCVGRTEILEDADLPIIDGINNFVHMRRWCNTLLSYAGQGLSVEIRELVLTGIEHEMDAFQLYITCDFWTDEEDEILKSKFEGKLPTAEKELQDGVVSRTKHA